MQRYLTTDFDKTMFSLYWIGRNVRSLSLVRTTVSSFSRTSENQCSVSVSDSLGVDVIFT